MQATKEKRTGKVEFKNTSLTGLKKELSGFETKYRMSTEEFLKKIDLGELAESNDFIDWLGAVELYQQIQRQAS